jgi:hypothetical protein
MDNYKVLDWLLTGANQYDRRLNNVLFQSSKISSEAKEGLHGFEVVKNYRPTIIEQWFITIVY